MKNLINNESSRLILFTANLFLFMNIYYIGRSVEHNLFHISILTLLNIFLILGLLLKDKLSNNKILFIIFTLLIFIPAYNRQFAISGIIDKNIKNFLLGNIFESEININIKDVYKEELVFINKNVPEKNIIILSQDDTYFFFLSGKKNLLNGNPQGEYFLKEDLDRALINVGKICPKKIITSCRLFGKNCLEDLMFFSYYRLPMESIILTNIEKKCNAVYEVEKCTKRLCLMKRRY